MMEAMAAKMAATSNNNNSSSSSSSNGGHVGRSQGAAMGGGASGPLAQGPGASSSGKRRPLEAQASAAFDKRLRFSVRQTESAYRYRDKVVKKQDGFTHILLSTKTSDNNSLNPEVIYT